MAYEALNFDGMRSSTSNYIEDVAKELDDKINDIVRSVQRASYGSAPINDYIPDSLKRKIDDFTYDEVTKAIDLLEDIYYEKVPTRDLMPEDTVAEKGHVFISPALDAIEERLAEIIDSGTTGEVKEVEASMLTQEAIDGLNLYLDSFRAKIDNMKLAMLNMYPTQDISGNEDWLRLISTYFRDDLNSDVYVALADLAQSAYQWAVSKGVTAEQLHSSFTASYNDLVTGMVDANAKAYHAEVMAGISNLENQLTKIDAELDIKSFEIDSQRTEYELNVKQYIGRLDQYVSDYTSDLSTNSAQLATRISGMKAVAEAYERLFTSYSQGFGAVSVGRQ